MEMLLGLVVMAGVPAYFVVQPATLWRWPGGWRIAALAPLLLTVPAQAGSIFLQGASFRLVPNELFVTQGLELEIRVD